MTSYLGMYLDCDGLRPLSCQYGIACVRACVLEIQDRILLTSLLYSQVKRPMYGSAASMLSSGFAVSKMAAAAYPDAL